jgi:hypothetical protein
LRRAIATEQPRRRDVFDQVAVGGAIRYRWADDGTGGRAAEGCKEK